MRMHFRDVGLKALAVVAMGAIAASERPLPYWDGPATEEWMVIWSNDRANPQSLDWVLRRLGLATSEDLFSPGEQEIFAATGIEGVGQSRLIRLPKQGAKQALERAAAQAGLQIALDPRSFELKNTAVAEPDPYAARQWAFDNRGQCQSVELDYRTNKWIPARAGEDIHWRDLPDVPGAKPILVAVMDTGVDVNHPDLSSVIYRNEPECRALDQFKACIQDEVDRQKNLKKQAEALRESALERGISAEEKARRQAQAKEIEVTLSKLDAPRLKCEKIWFDPNNPLVDLDRNQYPMDCTGWSVLGPANRMKIQGKPELVDTEGHGTHVAGVIGAAPNNGIGVRGVSRHVQILPVQVLGINPNEPVKPLSTDPRADLPMTTIETEAQLKQRKTLPDFVARGMLYAIKAGARVVNFSMGWHPGVEADHTRPAPGPVPPRPTTPPTRNAGDNGRPLPPSAPPPPTHPTQMTSLMRKMVEAAQKRGIVVVAAAGNDSTGALLSPCNYPGVICVGAHGPDGALSHFSNHGAAVDLAAPGLFILSTWPTDKRAIRFRDVPGYEFLHGTSQATPFVSGLIAEMLYQGMSPDEAYSRLVLGARPHQAPLDIVEGSPHQFASGEAACTTTRIRRGDEGKTTLAGNVDFAAALALEPTSFVGPSEKEKIIIPWDRKSADLKLRFKLTNHWVETPSVKVSAVFARPDRRAPRPELISVEPLEFNPRPWARLEEREYEATFKITDAAPARTRIPSDLELEITTEPAGGVKKTFALRAEIITSVNAGFVPEGSSVLPFPATPSQMGQFLAYWPVDLIFDGRLEYVDYIESFEGEKEWWFRLLAQDPASDPRSAPYVERGKLTIPAPSDPDKVRAQILMRHDLDQDGQSEYVIGLVTDNSLSGKPSPVTFYTLDSKFVLLRTETYDSQKSDMPFQISGIQVQWMKEGAWMVPSWVGFGKDPHKVITLKELRLNPNLNESQELRFYYLSQGKTLKALVTHEVDGQKFRIVDLLRPTSAQRKSGRVPILLARDTGTPRKPSYVFEFARAEISEGKIENFQKISLFSQGLPYRNLLDTRVDSVFSLSPGLETYTGTYWFGAGRPNEQRLSMLLDPVAKFFDAHVGAIRGAIDAALWVRAVFAGEGTRSAFVLTNSEIQFHDLTAGSAVLTSMQSYTFYNEHLLSNLQNPLVIGASPGTGRSKLPALYTTEVSRLNRGVRVIAPVYAADGTLLELVAPAVLRFKTESGCVPVETPVQMPDGVFAFDYLCKDRVVRVPLIY